MTGAAVLRFCGAAGTVTGSRFLIDAGASRVLIDVGLFQGNKALRLRNWAPFPVEPGAIDAVVLSHAHLDHVGYLPALARDGFRGPVYAATWTPDLAAIVLGDSARLQEEEAAYANRAGYSKHRPARPLYTTVDAERAVKLLRPVPLQRWVEVADGVKVRFHPAGHILGSASVEVRLSDPDHSVLFSGDLGRADHPLLRPPGFPVEADTIVVESTYGNRVHENQDAALERLGTAISRTAAGGGLVVIPAFAVDRTEVVLTALGRMVRQGRIPPLPVYVDSPMALAVLDVYRKALAASDPELRPEVIGTDPFDPGGELHEAPTQEQSKALNRLSFPSVIISSSGMATGGRILHHLAQRLPDPRNLVALVGFQAEGTRGRSLADGARSVKMLGRYVPVRARVMTVDAFSVHADGNELIDWMRHAQQAPTHTYVVHGEARASQTLATRIDAELGRLAIVPSDGERIRLG